MGRRSSYLPFAVCAVFVFSVSSAGCGGLKKMRNQVAKNMGVKTKKVTLKIADLGGGYKSMACTEFDFFATKKRKGKKKCKKAKGKLIKLQYTKFGVKSVDGFNRSANVLYGQYLLAGKMVDKTVRDIKSLTGKNVFKTAANDIATMLKKGFSKAKTVKKVKTIKKNLSVVLKSLGGLIDKASAVKNKGQGMVTKVPGEMAKNPARAIYADQAVGEVTTSVKRVSKVLTGTPKLLKKLYKLKDALW